MGIEKLAGAAAVAFALAIPAPAIATPFVPNRAEVTANDAAIVKIGYRYDKYRKFHGGISYVGDYGLKYAPSYWYRRHRGHDVTVKVYIGPPEPKDTRQRARPLIIDLSK
jgi:hypothetical protein